MPISPPRLDDRGFDDLVAELLARIPAHTPEWTDPRVGDPGRTLIELFAWLGDTLLYRANLIPERQRLVFLKLLGHHLRPATAARGIVTVGFNSRDPMEPVTLQRGATIDGPPSFESQSELTVLPVEGRVYAKRRLNPDEEGDMAEALHDLMDLYRDIRPGRVKQGDSPAGYITQHVFPDGTASRSGFDLVQDTVDAALWVALLAPTEALVPSIRAGLSASGEGRPYLMNLGLVPSLAPIDGFEELPPRVPRRMLVEVLTNERIDNRYIFSELDVAQDSSMGLLRDGVLRIGLAVGSFGAPSNDVGENPDAGMGDLPPRIDAEDDAKRIVGWIRIRPAEHLNSLPLTWLGINAVEVDNLRSYENLVVGTSDGRADQHLDLPASDVDPNTLQLEILEGDSAYAAWLRVDDLAAYGRDDRVYVLDAEAGRVHFGDGIRGHLPAEGARIRVKQMRAGGGAEGNLAAGSLNTIAGKDPEGTGVTVPLQVKQPLAMRGGISAETLAVAERRIPATLRHRNRAVTESDFRALAATTPGLRVGRVELLPRFKPHQRRHNVAGVISVMGLPAATTGGFRPRAPRPDRHFIETMHAHLDARRTLGTELYVIGPEYRAIAATVGVELRPGAATETTLAAVRLALRTFFWPLAPGGPGQQGWPLGQKVVAAHAEVAVARVPGVRALRGLRLFERTEAGDWKELTEATGRQLELASWQLPELLHVVAVAGQDAPEEVTVAPNPFLDDDDLDNIIPIPLVPEVC